jgi:copper oxidase (laccase) domain-containing protein
MESLGAQRSHIAAAIGPCISQVNYEVDGTFRTQFVDADISGARFFTPGTRPEHWQFDLEGFVAHCLARASVGSVVALHACTYARESAFFSFRRMTHRGEPDNGRQISAILLNPRAD